MFWGAPVVEIWGKRFWKALHFVFVFCIFLYENKSKWDDSSLTFSLECPWLCKGSWGHDWRIGLTWFLLWLHAKMCNKVSAYQRVLSRKPKWLGKATCSVGCWCTSKARKQIESRGFSERCWGVSGRCSTAQGQSNEGRDLESGRVWNLHNLQFSCVNSSK